jgi:beta-N-acetylhexosaminidase
MTDRSFLDVTGRLLMIGLEGTEVSAAARRLLDELAPGGIILFRRNTGQGPAQLANFIEECQEAAVKRTGRPLLVAIDQEGGPVTRLDPPFSVLPGQQEMARTLSREQVRALAAQSGLELAAVGINLNLSPVLDLATDPAARFMAERSFGPDESLAAELGAAWMEGHADHRVLTCAKHFPGIGDVTLDPHQDLPVVSYDLDRLRSREWVPFAHVIRQGMAAVMTAHVVFPALDPDCPGTFSPRILTGRLRRELGFGGLILTDDLEMGAVVRHQHLGSAAVQAVLAGADLLLVCHRPDRMFEVREALCRAAETGRIPRERLEASAARLDQALGRCFPLQAARRQTPFWEKGNPP